MALQRPPKKISIKGEKEFNIENNQCINTIWEETLQKILALSYPENFHWCLFIILESSICAVFPNLTVFIITLNKCLELYKKKFFYKERWLLSLSFFLHWISENETWSIFFFLSFSQIFNKKKRVDKGRKKKIFTALLKHRSSQASTHLQWVPVSFNII